jgi:hypothetical protein
MKIPKDELKETLDDMVKPFLWGYYTILIHTRIWHLSVRWWCSMYVLRALYRISRRESVFYLQQIADGIETIDLQVRPLVERLLQLESETFDLSEDDDAYKKLRVERAEVLVEIEDHYGDGDWPKCFKFRYSARLSWAIVDWTDQYVLPVIDRNMPWNHGDNR